MEDCWDSDDSGDSQYSDSSIEDLELPFSDEQSDKAAKRGVKSSWQVIDKDNLERAQASNVLALHPTRACKAIESSAAQIPLPPHSEKGARASNFHPGLHPRGCAFAAHSLQLGRDTTIRCEAGALRSSSSSAGSVPPPLRLALLLSLAGTKCSFRGAPLPSYNGCFAYASDANLGSPLQASLQTEGRNGFCALPL